MEGKRKWTEQKALKWLRDKNVMISGKRLYILGKSENGLTTLGAADYLKNNHGYILSEAGSR